MITLKQPFAAMKLKIKKSFRDRLNRQVNYIAQDKPQAARKFKNDILQKIKEIPKLPFGYRQSIFFQSENIRDLIFKGYIVVYKINISNNSIEVFGFAKWEDNPIED